MGITFWILAACLKAIGDILAFNFYASIFQTWNPLKYNPQENWQVGGAYNLFGVVRLDIYHYSVFAFIVSIAISAFHFIPYFPVVNVFGLSINLYSYILYALTWFGFFELTTKLLRRPYKK